MPGMDAHSGAFGRAAGRPVPLSAWLLIGVVGWAGVALVGLGLGPRAGDDLRLLVDAGQSWLAGQPLYVHPAGALDATSLFYSYPPVVAQALAPVSGVPFGVILVAWAAGAIAGFALVARALARDVLLPAVAVAPFAWPFAIALVFGNLNAWFPLVFGLVLLGMLRPGRMTTTAGGIGLAAATVAKLHPASIGLWLLIRGVREGRASAAWRILGAALAGGAVIVGLSLLVGGVGPWADWVAFLRSGSASADLVSRVNIGPASQVALLLGLDEAAARSLQVVVTAAALGLTVLAAWRVRDATESFGWAAAASLVILPVTWYHYPAALLPVALAAFARRAGSPSPPRVAALVAVAAAVSAVAIVLPVLVWVAVALVLAAARASRPAMPARSPAGVPERAPAPTPRP